MINKILKFGGDDRRRHARYICDIDTFAFLKDSENDRSTGRKIFGAIENISISGCLFKVQLKDLPQGKDISKCPIEIMIGYTSYPAKVVRHTYSGIHMAFDTNFTDESLKRVLEEARRSVRS